MDQNELKTIEGHCIQEESPECTAACPLHIEAREFIRFMARDDWSKAWTALRKIMPLAGVLGRICDGLCQARCKRSEAGGAIEIAALERALVQTPAPRFRVLPLPAKDGKVAILGGGLAGLTAAWDLLRKGYPVHLFAPAPKLGGPLWAIDRNRLPAEAIMEETARLIDLGLTAHLEEDPGSKTLEAWLADFDAVFLGLDDVTDQGWPLERTPEGRIKHTPLTQLTGQSGVFVGGYPGKNGPSPVQQAAEGRWAAASIDRFLQKVSLTAGREKEGPRTTRLFTSLEGVESLPATPMADPASGFTIEEARAEADRCLDCQCLECVKVCPYLERFGAYPKKYAREIYNNASIVMGARQANTLINSCSLCGLCQEVCPEDFAMQTLCLEARQDMVRREKMPPQAHEFALLDMEFSQGPRFSLVRTDPDKNRAAAVFFPGCQLGASAPNQVIEVYHHLRRNNDQGIGLALGCCGAPAHWAGRDDLFAEILERWRDQWQGLNRPVMILACSTCHQMFQEHAPDIPVISLWTFLAENPPDWRISSDLPTPDRLRAVHDPCTTRHEHDIQANVRRLMDLFGINRQELNLTGSKTECCGFGGLMLNANPDLAKEVIARRSRQSDLDYLTYCAMCRDSLAWVGKRAIHLLDLFFPPDSGKDPAERKRPGWTERQENRAWLKATLLRTLWHEETPMPEEHQSLPLHIPPQIMDILDQRRILVEDLQRVILQAEKSGAKFRHPVTGHFQASFKPFKTVFWVEYSQTRNGFEVHNAYSHRMDVSSGGTL